MARAQTTRFRYNPAALVAAAVVFIGTLPIATARWYLLPTLFIPLLVAGWALRAGTDADQNGLCLRALVGQRRITWSQISELTGDSRGHAIARLTDGRVTTLPAVRTTDLPRLVAASGQPLNGQDGDLPVQDPTTDTGPHQ